MVAKVISGKTIRGVISYNENKVKEGTADCIFARGFAGEAKQLSFADKLSTFAYYIRQNTKVTTNAVHISLNFDPKEKLSDDKLRAISSNYLDKIGFGLQPFLIYRHFDAAHPHVHIVTTNVQLDSRKISLNNIGRDKSERARKEIEVEFSLVKATGRKVGQEQLKAADLSRALYGKSETKRAISNIVNAITRSYKFASIHELNAVLKQYNVIADPGREGSIVHLKKGLCYSLVDKNGNSIGVPIKASSIYGKPTLKSLTNQFELNELLKTPHKERVKQVIDNFIQGEDKTLKGLVNHCIANQIFPVVRQNEEGRIYGLTFIDDSTKCVFNGSSLGKQYSAKGILDRLGKQAISCSTRIRVPSLPVKEGIEACEVNRAFSFETNNKGLLETFTEAKLDHSNAPYEMRRKKKRKGKSI
jgi:hypothetical protein